MLLKDLLDTEDLQKEIDRGYINVQYHPKFPELAIYNYCDPKHITNSEDFNYADFWSHTVSTCRGLVVDISTGEVIARPLKKFHNLNQGIRIDDFIGMDIELTTKVDGWYSNLIHYKNEWFMSSRGSFISTGAQFATKKFEKFVKYGAVEEIPKGWTLIFEIIFKDGQIILEYPYEGIVLLVAKNIETGEEMRYSELKKLWERINSEAKNKPWCRLVDKVDLDILDATQLDIPKEEGYVITGYRDGGEPVKAKIKFKNYIELQRLFSHTSPQEIWHNMAYPVVKYNEPDIPSKFRAWAREVEKDLLTKFYEELYIVRNLSDDVSEKYSRYLNIHETSLKLSDHYSEYIPLVELFLKRDWVNFHRALWSKVRPHGKVVYRPDIIEDDI